MWGSSLVKSLDGFCKRIFEYFPLAKVIVAVLNIVACIGFYTYSAYIEVSATRHKWVSLMSSEVKEDPCNGLRIYEAELRYDAGLYALFYAVYGLLEIIASMLMASSLNDKKKDFHPIYTAWLTLELTLLSFLILHGAVLHFSNQVYAQTAWDHSWALAWKLLLFAFFNPLSQFKEEQDKTKEEDSAGRKSSQGNDPESGGNSTNTDVPEVQVIPKNENCSSEKTTHENNSNSQNQKSEAAEVNPPCSNSNLNSQTETPETSLKNSQADPGAPSTSAGPNGTQSESPDSKAPAPEEPLNSESGGSDRAEGTERKSQSEGDAGSTSTNSHEARDEPQ
ncbi:unnamed protein product, partial [Allacma fusca]